MNSVEMMILYNLTIFFFIFIFILVSVRCRVYNLAHDELFRSKWMNCIFVEHNSVRKIEFMISAIFSCLCVSTFLATGKSLYIFSLHQPHIFSVYHCVTVVHFYLFQLIFIFFSSSIFKCGIASYFFVFILGNSK